MESFTPPNLGAVLQQRRTSGIAADMLQPSTSARSWTTKSLHERHCGDILLDLSALSALSVQ
jgi:hypothetical protein